MHPIDNRLDGLGDVSLAQEAIVDVDQYIVADDYSLDKRFTSKQLEVMKLRADEYRDSGRRQKSHITRACAGIFIANILDAGEMLTKAERGKILEVPPLLFIPFFGY